MTTRRSAGLAVEIFPLGQSGLVHIAVRNLGPETLTRREAISALRAAMANLGHGYPLGEVADEAAT